jgi:dihydrofolate synthase/folylpolyglutamate synthase
LRAILEAQGLTVHTATKPHLVRYNERIRVAGDLISDESLADLLERVLDASEDLGPSFFEVTTVATFLAFAETPADACVIETGLGGRLDATNVLEHPAVCGIATLGIDHEAFLLVPEAGTPEEPLARIAFEKASIAKPGAPLVVQSYAASPLASVLATASRIGAPVLLRGRDWWADIGETIRYRDAQGTLDLPLPSLAGAHQADNAALAIAMLRHQSTAPISAEAMATGIRAAHWPARLQRLGPGPLTAIAGQRTVWLDGGHNPDAGLAIAHHFANAAPLHLVMGMLTSKDPSAILRPLEGRLTSVSIVPAPGHEAHTPADFAPFTRLLVRRFANVAEALAALPPAGDVLIAGSLYLAGDVLRRNDEAPT